VVSTRRRDELAARVAGSLATTELSPAQVAARAYAVADALLAHAEGAWPIHELLVGDDDAAIEATPHDPRWELEPRWSRRDRQALERARCEAGVGPGLASTRPAVHKRDRDAG
jgi:hypothetical protein